MDRSIVLSILGAATLGFVGMLLLMPDPIEDGIARLPWLIEQDASGRTQVFGFTLGATTLAEVRQVFREDGEINLFRMPGPSGMLAAEVYFEQIYLERLRADFVLTLDVDQATLTSMYDRGLRISQTGSGSQKVKLDPNDAKRLAGRPIRAIVYLPKARLDEALIEQRFGAPTQRLSEAETGIVHWLYPERGLDIGRDPSGRVVMQYVNPADFDAILEPLVTVDRD
ncbi:hypothetical protein [Allochromatium palmeri]|uniref:Uncharacterized protein n=1 Tax=Allochromatium palmeri TaxID=231048 RepID=A0A6N8EBE8_9GAMM|nr:hypothetical protein [Allochromatium palmeri]MTW21572.1 hypothetical protein [Allochromatium palmeri]